MGAGLALPYYLQLSFCIFAVEFAGSTENICKAIKTAIAKQISILVL